MKLCRLHNASFKWWCIVKITIIALIVAVGVEPGHGERRRLAITDSGSKAVKYQQKSTGGERGETRQHKTTGDVDC